MQASKDVRDSMFMSIREWQSSGKTQKAFCEERDIRYHVFHYWYKVFKDSKEEHVCTAAHFVQLKVPSVSSDVFAEITYCTGNKVILHQPVSSAYLKALL